MDLESDVGIQFLVQQCWDERPLAGGCLGQESFILMN